MARTTDAAVGVRPYREEKPAHMVGGFEGMAEDLRALLRYDPTAYEQYNRRSLAEVPERELAVAVMRQAIEDLDRLRGWLADGPHGIGKAVRFNQKAATETEVRRWYAKTRAWFLSDDESWPFSFAPICGALGLSPDPIRRWVRQVAPAITVCPEQRRREYHRGELAARLWAWAEGRAPWALHEAVGAMDEPTAVVLHCVRNWLRYGRAERLGRGVYVTIQPDTASGAA